MIDVIIPTCDKYINLTKATLYSISEFWSNNLNIIIIGYCEPLYQLPDNCKFVSLGDDETPKKWTNGLLKFFNNYQKEHFILHMDDHCIIKKVDNDKVDYLCDMIKNDNTIDKIMLTNFMYDGVNLINKDKIPVFSYPQNGVYRTSLMNAVWRVDYFKKFLNLNLSPWEFEEQKNQGKNDGAKILTIEEDLIMVSSLMSNGSKINDNWYNEILDKYNFDPPTTEFKNKIDKMLEQFIAH